MDHPTNIRTSPRAPLSLFEQQMIKEFWRNKQEKIVAIENFGERTIPVTCLKKVICAEMDKMMMTSDTPTFLTKACEIFVQELSVHAWVCASSHNRSMILDSDIAEVIASIESYDFLNDVLRTHFEKYKSDPCLQSTKRPYHHMLTSQSSTSLESSFHQYEMTQFIPQSTRYNPFLRIPPPLPPTNAKLVHLPSLPHPPQKPCSKMANPITPTPIVCGSFPPMTYMTKDLGFFRECISNNNVALDLMTPQQLLPEALPPIPNNCYMSTIASTDTYCVGSASNSNLIAQDGDMAFHFSHVSLKHFQLSSSSTMDNIACSIYINVVELNHTESDVTHIGNSTHGTSSEATFNVTDGQQKHMGDETTASHHMNVVHGELDSEVVTTTNVDADDNNTNWDEIEMASDSMLMEFWKDVMMEEDPTPLPVTISPNDLIVLPSDILEVEGCCHDSYLLDGIMSDTSTNGRHS